MNTGQTLLSIGALTLLSVIILRVNNSFLTTNTVMQESKFGLLAVSLAESIIQEANHKTFDAQTDGNPIHDVSLLTGSSGLGPNSSESYSTFNDFDDYNGFDTTITNLPSATFNLHCDVCYVNPSNPDIPTNNRTWNKKITVTVSSPFSKDTIKVSSIFSYWYFQ